MKIFLDAGHGGSDPGACGNGLKEKDLTLTIAKKIGALLGEYEGVKVSYTRTDDRFLSLSERAEMANRDGADYFASIHINAGGGTGWESFIHTNASAKSVVYQNVIHPEIIKLIGGIDRGKKRANYGVLRMSNMPAILTENLFIDNPADAAKLKDDAFLQKIAQGHVTGFEKAFVLKKKTVSAGWVKEAGKWYFYKDGQRQTGWLKDNNEWYYLGSDGAAVFGWLEWSDKWYYLIPENESGRMAKGIQAVGGKLYYFNPDGTMLTDGRINVSLNVAADGSLHP